MFILIYLTFKIKFKMRSLKIKSLKEGMVTAAEVKDRMGRTLLTSGQTITAQNLKTLKAWGIADVAIEDSAAPKKASQEVEEIEIKASPAIVKEQETLFKNSDRRHPAIAELYDVCLSRKVQMQLED
jgi:hypothetical protein